MSTISATCGRVWLMKFREHPEKIIQTLKMNHFDETLQSIIQLSNISSFIFEHHWNVWRHLAEILHLSGARGSKSWSSKTHWTIITWFHKSASLQPRAGSSKWAAQSYEGLDNLKVRTNLGRWAEEPRRAGRARVGDGKSQRLLEARERGRVAWAGNKEYKYHWYFILVLRARSRLYRRRSLKLNT